MDVLKTSVLETDRLRLRRFTDADLPAILEIYADREVNTFLPWFPITSLEEGKKLYEQRYAAAYRQPCHCRYAICRKEDDIPIGYVHLDLGESHDLGYGLRKEFWHQGMVTEACEAVIRQIRQAGIPFVTATHDIRNPRSGLVMRRLGMQYQYSYQEQWQPKNILVTFRLYQLNLDGNNKRCYRKYWEQSSVHFVESDL